MRITRQGIEEGSLTVLSHFLTLLGRRLDTFSRKDALFLLIAFIAIIALLDFQFHPYVILGPLYILPMCLACWRVGPKAGFATAFLAASLPMIAGIANGHKPPLAGSVANLILQTVVLGFVAAIVSSFRHIYDREASLSKRDHMTGALNKQAFIEQAETMRNSARIGSLPLLLLFADLDGFKDINDQNDHATGDALLQSFAAELASATQKTDAFSRVGGDEFAALLQVATIAEAANMATAIHQRVSTLLAGGLHPVTCSMGALIILPDHKLSFPALLRAADQLMYDIKHNGKNGIRIAVADSFSVEEPDISLATASESTRASFVA